MNPTRTQRRQLERDNLKWPSVLKEVPKKDWDLNNTQKGLTGVWRSSDFLVQIFSEREIIIRMSVCRTSYNGERWEENISWDDLQRLKRECGFGNMDAVEIYPSDIDIVNVANMRHLWILPAGNLYYAWRRS